MYPAKRNDLERFCNRGGYVDMLRVEKREMSCSNSWDVQSIEKKKRKNLFCSREWIRSSILVAARKCFSRERERESLKTWARGKGCVGVVLERVYAKVLDTWTIDDKKRSWHGLAKRFVLFFLSFFFFFFPPPLPPRELFPLETIEQCFGPLRAGETVEEEAVACGRGSRRRETGGGEVPVYNLLGRATIMFSRATVPTSQCEPKKHHYRVQFIKYLLECRD